MEKLMDPTAVALRFNDCINSGDVEGLISLMTTDHRFTDTLGVSVDGLEENREIWRRFFELYPGYRNVFEKVTAHGDTVTMEGYSLCQDPVLNNIRAVWTAVIEYGKVGEWRVTHC